MVGLMTLGLGCGPDRHRLLVLLLHLMAIDITHGATQASGRGLSKNARRCTAACYKHGTCNEELGRCDCPKHRTGTNCGSTTRDLELTALCKRRHYLSVEACVSAPLPCLNACNQRGVCESGWCHCSPGYYGADCSLSLDERGKPRLLAGTTYTTRAKRPWIYVYELPPSMNVWANTANMDRRTYLRFWQRLLSSGARTADGDKADWYFIPIHQRVGTDAAMRAAAVKYLMQTWPWYNRTQGHRHFIIHTGDLGRAEEGQETMDLFPNITWLTHWGLTKDANYSSDTTWRSSHRPDKDVVIPVLLNSPRGVGIENSPLHPRTDKPRRSTTFYFAGRICGDQSQPRVGKWPNCGRGSSGYSLGVRQSVHYHHASRNGYRVVTHERNHSQYGPMLASSTFCLAPLGGGHGQRQIIVSAMGCIPVSISDHVLEPFEPQLDWSKFGVRPAQADIPNLHRILAGISKGEVASMQRKLRCVAQHFFYSSIVGGIMGEDGRYDAFETTLEVLRVKALYPDAQPEDYRKLDADFAAFMECRQPKGFAVSAPKPAPGALCSHAAVDRDTNPCTNDFDRSHGSPVLGMPGGYACGEAWRNLAACPRVWL